MSVVLTSPDVTISAATTCPTTGALRGKTLAQATRRVIQKYLLNFGRAHFRATDVDLVVTDSTCDTNSALSDLRPVTGPDHPSQAASCPGAGNHQLAVVQTEANLTSGSTRLLGLVHPRLQPLNGEPGAAVVHGEHGTVSLAA